MSLGKGQVATDVDIDIGQVSGQHVGNALYRRLCLVPLVNILPDKRYFFHFSLQRYEL